MGLLGSKLRISLGLCCQPPPMAKLCFHYNIKLIDPALSNSHMNGQAERDVIE